MLLKSGDLFFGTKRTVVQNSANGGLLLKRLQAREPALARITGYRVRLVESGGYTPI